MAQYVLTSLDTLPIKKGTAVYVAGPMTGYPNFNYNAFHAVAMQLRKCGHLVISPAERVAGVYSQAPDLATVTPERNREFLREGFRRLLDADALVLLPGWEHSTGAKHERAIAMALDFDVYELSPSAMRELVVPDNTAP